MQVVNRRCWWCNTRLSANGYAEIQDQLGNTVRVHKVCEKAAAAGTKQVTATSPTIPLGKDYGTTQNQYIDQGREH